MNTKNNLKELYLNISSKDRVRGTNSNFFLDFTTINIEKNKQYECMIKSITFPNTIYQLSLENNNLSFEFSEAGGAFGPCNFTAGNYTITEFCAQLKLILETFGVSANTYNCLYDPIQNRLSIKRLTGADNFSIRFSGNNTNLLFGADKNTTYNATAPVDTIVMPNQVDLIPIKNIFILNSRVSNENYATVSNKTWGQNVMLNFALDAPRNSVIFFHENEIESNKFKITQFGQQHQISIINEEGQIISYEGDIRMTLKIKQLD